MAAIELLHTVVFLTLLVGFISILYYRRFGSVEKFFVYYIWMSAFFELFAMSVNLESVNNVLVDYGWKNNLPGLHLFTILQFILLVLFFSRVLQKYLVDFLWKIVLIIGSLLILANSIFIQSIFEFNSYSKTVVELAIILASMFYFVKLMLSDIIKDHNVVLTYFVTAVFVNASVSILIHLFSNSIMQMEQEFLTQLWNVRTMVNILTQFIILYGIYLVITRERKLQNRNQLDISHS